MEIYQLTSRCYPKDGKTHVKKNWLSNKKFYIGKTNLGNRYMIKVNLFKEKKVNYFMDIMTGSFYNESGACMSSSQIRCHEFTEYNVSVVHMYNEITNKLKMMEIYEES
jgi:predicted transcriptional regulator of viral defense system